MSVGRHIARLLINCEDKDGETKKAHLSVSLFDTAYGAAPGVELIIKSQDFEMVTFRLVMALSQLVSFWFSAARPNHHVDT